MSTSRRSIVTQAVQVVEPEDFDMMSPTLSDISDLSADLVATEGLIQRRTTLKYKPVPGKFTFDKGQMKRVTSIDEAGLLRLKFKAQK